MIGDLNLLSESLSSEAEERLNSLNSNTDTFDSWFSGFANSFQLQVNNLDQNRQTAESSLVGSYFGAGYADGGISQGS